MENLPFLLAALADFTGVIVHGVIGHRAIMTPLTRDRLFATPSFGDADMTWRIFAVSFHVVTATFACSGVAFLWMALGHVEGPALPRFLVATHAAFLVVAGVLVGPRALSVFRRPIPITFAVCMTTVCVGGWLGAR